MLERAKPRPLPGATTDYLLTAPFRHRPRRFGSRFGKSHERGIWYGSDDLTTCLAEVAFYRFVFLAGTKAELGDVQTQHTAFTAKVRTREGVDLTVPPFSRHRGKISSPMDYQTSQQLGSEMRGAGVAAFRFFSARWRDGTNVGLFTPDAFASRQPIDSQSWICLVRSNAAMFARSAGARHRQVIEFDRTDFLVNGILPQPAP